MTIEKAKIVADLYEAIYTAEKDKSTSAGNIRFDYHGAPKDVFDLVMRAGTEALTEYYDDLLKGLYAKLGAL